MKNIIFSLIFVFTSVLIAEDSILEDSLEDILNMKTELKADVGSRSGATSFLESRAPIDVITYDEIEHSGLTSLTDVLRYFVAGFNAPNPSVSDGSNFVRAFTLRGMSPDQTLVLINGKRLHTSALLHVNGAIGRGSSHVDLDTIALNSIEKVEILRDGAAAQYGSDAISGVINIILKGIGHKNSMNVHTGQRKSADGTKLQTDLFLSTAKKYDGFINLSLSAEQSDKTQRAGLDRRLTPPSIQTHYGLPKSKSFNALLNIELPQEDNTNIYANVLMNYRDSKASAFYRTPDANRSIYPNGFLPMLNANIFDTSFTIGVNGELSYGIYWDLSNVLGYNKIDLSIDESMNYALGALSPTSFDNGSMSFLQNTTNLDLKKSIAKFDIAGGLEYRYENYEIQAGEIASYYNGGSQGFSGFRGDNETDSSRTNYAVYADVTYHAREDLSLEGALRYEDFSDFSSTANAKVALDYKLTQDLLFRTSASTGFRAPSLSQSHYSLTSSNIDADGSIVIQGTFKPDHEVSQVLGAEPLKPEQSKHFAIGSVYNPTQNFSLMMDYYYIEVKDKIMLSSELAGTTAQQIAILLANGVKKARFLTNAVDTRTQGVDIKLQYKHTFEDSLKLDFLFWYSYNKNTITAFNTDFIRRDNSFRQIDMIENGQPKDAVRILTHLEKGKYDFIVNISRYGSYRQALSDTDTESYKFDSMITTDVELSYEFSKTVNVAIGANNVFDVVANKWNDLSGIVYGNDGILPYSNYSPAGYSGAYYYVKASVEF